MPWANPRLHSSPAAAPSPRAEAAPRTAPIQWRRRRSCRWASSARRGRTRTTAVGCGPSRPSMAAPSPRQRSPPPPRNPSSTRPTTSSPASPAPASLSPPSSGAEAIPSSRSPRGVRVYFAWRFDSNRPSFVQVEHHARYGADPPRGALHGEESGVPQAAQVRPAPRLWWATLAPLLPLVWSCGRSRRCS